MGTNKAGILVMAGVLAVAIIGFVLMKNGKPPVQTETNQPTTAAPAVSSAPSAAEKTGTFAETVSYSVHDDPETLTVTVTLENGVVKELKTAHTNTKPFSSQMHEKFDGAIQDLVIGKKLNELALEKVGGASFTTKAFMEAVGKMK